MSAYSEAPQQRVLFSLMICLFGVGLVSCAAKIDPEIKQRAQAIPVLAASEIEGRSYDLVAEVEGKDCNRGALSEYSSVSHDEGASKAVWKLRIAAAQVGADAIVHLSCVDKLGWPSVDCGMFQIECRGHAIRWRAEEESEARSPPYRP
jgi:uncharacterized protein YbjQ (UPF0145 family)